MWVTLPGVTNRQYRMETLGANWWHTASSVHRLGLESSWLSRGLHLDLYFPRGFIWTLCLFVLTYLGILYMSAWAKIFKCTKIPALSSYIFWSIIKKHFSSTINDFRKQWGFQCLSPNNWTGKTNRERQL